MPEVGNQSQNGNQQEEFWAEVKDKRIELAVSLQKKEFEGQPAYQERLLVRNGRVKMDTNAIYLTSRRNRDRGTFAGHVILMPVELAAQKLIEQTHEVSTDVEISDFLASQAERREEIRMTEINKKMQFHQAVPAGGGSPMAAFITQAPPEFVPPVPAGGGRKNKPESE